MSELIDSVRQTIRDVRELAGVTARVGVSDGDLTLLEQRLECYLPAAYRTLLQETNGIEVGRGANRWFGYGPGAPIDVVVWNDPGAWKWAYAGLDDSVSLDDFLFFRVRADGNLIGCHRADLQHRGSDPPAFAFGPVVRPMAVRRPLSMGILNGLVATARRPDQDPFVAAVLDRFGSVPGDALVVHSPVKFPHFSDDETDLDGAVLLPAVDAMVARADVWREVARLREGDRVTGVEVWVDDEGRDRLRLVTEGPERDGDSGSGRTS